MFDTEDSEEVERGQFRKAVDYVIQTCERAREGNIDLDQLVISKILRKPRSSEGPSHVNVGALRSSISFN